MPTQLPRTRSCHRGTAAAALVMATAITVTGCGAINILLPYDRPTTSKSCTSTVVADGRSEPLGSGDQFVEVALAHIAAKSQGVTLDRIAEEAGWHGEWDRLIQVSPTVTDEAINRSIGSVGVCYDRPYERQSEDELIGTYIFFDGNRAVQSMTWRGESEFLRTADGYNPIPVYRNQPLVADPPWLVTEPLR